MGPQTATIILTKGLNRMQHSPSVPWRALRAALGLGTAAVVSLAMAGVASANVLPITPDGSSGSDNLGAAIASANTNSASSNTIVLSPGIYTPADKGNGSTDVEPITITKNLTIVGPHSYQTPTNQAATQDIQGAVANSDGSGPLFVINPGVTVTFEGVGIDGAGTNAAASIQDNGNLQMYGVTMEGPPGNAINISSGASATLNEYTLDSALGDGIVDDGSLTMNNSTMTAGTGNGIDLPGSGYTLNLNNTALYLQEGPECFNGAATNGGPGSLDDDGTCHVQYSDDTNSDNDNDNTVSNGGPVQTVNPTPGTTSPDFTDKGVNCPTVDGRFFVNPVVGGVTQCDIGAYTNSATQETAGPKCTITGGSAGPPATQQVSLVDTGSGVGPQAGPDTDNPSNTVATTYPPPAAVPVPGDSVSNLQIDNGTVAAPTPLLNPAVSPLVLTATKTTAGTLTHWSFTGLNWAGVATNCF
jgi:hypothetical protein